MLVAGAGYGKTTVLDEALSGSARPVAWISCSETERAPGMLLKRMLDAISEVAPGASDALAERLATATEQVDALAAARELLAEIPRLLSEPIVLVVDDAEHLTGAEQSLRLLSELIRAEPPPVHVAIASRVPLELRVAKPRAAGRLVELRTADLAFDAEECEALLLTREDREPSAEEVGGLMEATEGWPLGVTLAVTLLSGSRVTNGAPELRSLRSAPDVRAYLSEELMDSLEPDLREGAIESSVTRVVTPEIVSALGLPDNLGGRLERAGMLVRRVDGNEAFAYHPLLRELLLERLEVERGEEERLRLHAAAAPALAASGDSIEAIELWLQARSWPEAVAAIEEQGPLLVRSSGGLVGRWLALLPADARALPAIRSLEGQLEWGLGNHPRAAEVLRDAVRGFGDAPDAPAEWFARFMLVDALFSTGEFDELGGLAEGWDDPAAAGAGVLAPATVMYIAIALATVGRFEESDRLAAGARSHPDAGLLGPVEALRLAFRDTPSGHLDRVLVDMEAAVAELEQSDPFNRRLYFQASLALMFAERGRPDEALAAWLSVRDGALGAGAGPMLVDSTHAWCAVLHAQQGRLQEAEAELARYEGQEQGWRSYVGHLARACVAALRGDTAETVANGERAMAVVADGPIVFRHWNSAHLIPALISVGRTETAAKILEQTFVLIDVSFPGPQGCFPRGRLLALRAWIHHTEGDTDSADADLLRFWDEAGETLPHTLRREWVRLEQPVWDALERGSLDPVAAIEAIAEAFPEGLVLVAFLDHPVADVRRASLAPATESGDPRALVRLGELADDPDAELATGAIRAAERLARTLPPLRFELLGDFAVGRGSWRVGDGWGRPVDARLVRYLLVHVDRSVPEDVIREALWPDLSEASARSSLQVAASRARKVLDAPGAEGSVIEGADRTYRLALGERDTVDVEEFRSAAAAAVAERGEAQLGLLERARSLWTAEPLAEDRYSDWAMAYRERLIDLYTDVLAALVRLYDGDGEHARAAEAARELVDLDPLNEGGHRALITAYARSGRTGHALRQYLECRRALVEQLGIEPAEATSRLQARILAGEQV